ncbi:MAG: cation transporter [Alicyclobacillaceae bacterium]|nr:cation transporter [Alicyclobacillaceae bacterium]
MSGVVLLARLTAECNAAGPAAGASGASDVTHRADGARDCPQPQHAQTLSQDSGIHMPHANGHGGERMPGWERWASAVVAGCLFVLAGFVAWKSGQAFALRQAPAATPLGLAVTAASGLITPWFALRKRRLGRILGSRALLGDAACSFACAYMAWTVLAGLALQWLTGIWWLDPLAALGILGFVVREAWESADSARTGEVHVHG